MRELNYFLFAILLARLHSTSGTLAVGAEPLLLSRPLREIDNRSAKSGNYQPGAGLSPDGSLAVLATAYALLAFDADTGALLGETPLYPGGVGSLCSLTVSGDPPRVILVEGTTFPGEGFVRVVDPLAGTTLLRVRLCDSGTAFFGISLVNESGTHLVTGGLSQFCRMNALLQAAGSGPVNSASLSLPGFTNDGEWIAVKSTETGTPRLIAATDGLTPRTFPGQSIVDSGPASYKFSGDGKLLLEFANYEITIWDVSSGTILHSKDGMSLIYDAALSPDGSEYITLQAAPNNLKRWNATSGEAQGGISTEARWARYALSGARFLTISADRCDIWDSSTGNLVSSISESGISPVSKVFTIDGVADQGLAAQGSKLTRWGLNSGAKLEEIDTKTTAAIHDLSPDGNLILDFAEPLFGTRTLLVRETHTGAIIRTLTYTGLTSLHSANFTPDGQSIAVWVTYGTFLPPVHARDVVERFNIASGAVEASREWLADSNFAIDISPNARRGLIASGLSDGCLVDIDTGDCLWQRPELIAASFSADASVAFVTKPGGGEWVEVATGQTLASVPDKWGGAKFKSRGLISVDGQRVAIDSDADRIFIWNIADATTPELAVDVPRTDDNKKYWLADDLRWLTSPTWLDSAALRVWPLIHPRPLPIEDWLLGGAPPIYPLDRNDDGIIDVADRAQQLIGGY